MKINSSMTHWHKTYNTESRTHEWKRSVIEDVFWTGGKGASVNTGYTEANDVTIRVWLHGNDLTGVTFEIGDIVAQGIIDKEIEKESDLIGIPNVYNLTTVIKNDFGSEPMQHYHLGGK